MALALFTASAVCEAYAGSGKGMIISDLVGASSILSIVDEFRHSIDYTAGDPDIPRPGEPTVVPDYARRLQPKVDGHATSLEDLFNEARGYSLRLQADGSRQTAAVAAVKAAEMSFYPTVNVGANLVAAGHITYSADSSVTSSYPDKRPSQIAVQATLPIYDGFKRVNTLRAAEALVEAGRHITVATQQQVYLDTATAALKVIRDRKVVELRQAGLSIAQKISAGTDHLVADQMATRTDGETAKAEINRAKSDLLAARGALEASELDFARLVGHRPPNRLHIDIPANLPANADEAEEIASREAPEGRVARLGAIAASYSAEAVMADMLPKLDATASAGFEYGTSPDISRSDDYNVMLRLTIPLIDLTTRRRLEGARAEAMQMRYEAQDKRRDIGFSARALFEQRSTLTAEIVQLRRQIVRAQAIAEGMRKEREAGARTLDDVLKAENEVVSAKAAVVEAEFQSDRAAFQLLAQAGALTAAGGSLKRSPE